MATIDFKSIITDEAITYARAASTNAGWHLTPVKWAISTSQGDLSTSRTTNSMFTPWIQQPFSGIYASGSNKLLHSVVIPPDAYATEMVIGELYFIYTDYYGNEFLYAIAQPTGNLTFTPGVSQSYVFTFTLNNTNVADTVEIKYTYPQDIDAHNNDAKAHSYLVATDGSRNLTDILSYDRELSFNNDRQIVDKGYVDKSITPVIHDINTTYCPPGSMMWWPRSTPPTGWVVRHGQALSRTTYSALFNVIGTTYGAGNGSTTFNVPDDRGRFIRGYLSGTTAGFGQTQGDGLPNITGGWSWDFVKNVSGGWGAIARGSTHASGGGSGKTLDYTDYSFDASRVNSIYGAANEVRPKNRNYLPIIKY